MIQVIFMERLVMYFIFILNLHTKNVQVASKKVKPMQMFYISATKATF